MLKSIFKLRHIDTDDIYWFQINYNSEKLSVPFKILKFYKFVIVKPSGLPV